MATERSGHAENASTFALDIIQTSFNVIAVSHIWGLRALPAATRQLFVNNPEQHGPNILSAELDISGETLAELKQSPWNQELIWRLARHAWREFEQLNAFHESELEEVDWMELITAKIN
ncbi:hypothetical protein GYMLUDRAFT_64063 [Collybiopsis luxurians FD-317 M1]|uniref:Unplaced genomic scaffold GYMLUscaffold_89, whole genome shotgun sequence n=1 Tax=Collybiopsis luxurians FD-317 M1 TaxID=944289 RepID=A0A0D0BDY1_9AGAR|nr:hypothetical protein GYMLUDRAFT_64063 [Collybiopsis luxurians FD-317 M1]